MLSQGVIAIDCRRMSGHLISSRKDPGSCSQRERKRPKGDDVRSSNLRGVVCGALATRGYASARRCGRGSQVVRPFGTETVDPLVHRLQRDHLVILELIAHDDDEVGVAVAIEVAYRERALEVGTDERVGQGVLNAGDHLFEDPVEVRVGFWVTHHKRCLTGKCTAARHRVVRADDDVAGDRWGIERKGTLLAREAAMANSVPGHPGQSSRPAGHGPASLHRRGCYWPRGATRRRGARGWRRARRAPDLPGLDRQHVLGRLVAPESVAATIAGVFDPGQARSRARCGLGSVRTRSAT
jgi:hypothetical protein